MDQSHSNGYGKTGVPEISMAFLVLIFSVFLTATANAELLTLPAGLKLVTENSRLIKITGHEEKMSEADTLIARAKTLPEINASGGYTSLAYQPEAIFGSQSVPMSERNFLFYSLSIQQTLYDFQKSASRYEASQKMLNAKKLDAARIRNLVAIDFVLVYLDLLESENMLKVAAKEVERLQSHLREYPWAVSRSQSLVSHRRILKNRPSLSRIATVSLPGLARAAAGCR